MTGMPHDVVTIGNAIVDVIRRCDDAFLERVGVRKGRMNFAQGPASVSEVCKYLRNGFAVAGGSAANTAVGVASLGGRSAFIGKVAEDQFGNMFCHDIRGTGVEFAATPVTADGSQTSRSLIMITPDGQRTMMTYLGCSSDLETAVIDRNTIKNSKFIYLEGYLFDRLPAKRAFERAVAMANAAGKRVALTLSDPYCVDRHRQEFLQLIRSGVSILFANESEIMSLYQVKNFDDAVRSAGRDVELAVLTRGAIGSLAVSKGDIKLIRPETVSKVVDVTGAGDMYAAGFLYGLSRDLGLETAGRLGSFAASEIISIWGARPEVRLGHLARMRGLIL